MQKFGQTILIVFALCLAAISFNSCCEKEPPGIDKGDTRAADSNYVAPLEAKQEKVILIEELTGVRCQNCPGAARNIKTISEANPHRILTIAMHPPSSVWTEPITNKSVFDFRISSADEIMTLLGGLPSFPSGSINRTQKTSGEIFDSSWPGWVNRITPLLAETTPVNMHLQSSYDAENNKGELVAQVAFTEDIDDELFITAFVLEDGIKDYQVDGDDYIPDYEHNHVYRKIITSVSGSSLNFADKKAGTVLQKRISYEANLEGVNAWNLDNCHIVAFVHKSGSDQSILQAAEVSLK